MLPSQVAAQTAVRSPWFDSLDNMFTFAASVGCPADQVLNFLRGGYIPQPKQLMFHAAARACDVPGGPDQVGFGGSRGPGKSHAIFAQLALDDCQRLPGLKVLYLRRLGRAAREQFNDLRKSVLNEDLTPHHYGRNGVVEFPNGSQILVGHFKDEKDIDGFLGIEYDIIVIEEATTLTASKYQGLRDSNRSSKPGWRPRIYNSTNPGNIGHTWYKNRFIEPYRRNEQQYTRFIPATLDDNAFIDDGYRRRVEENVGWKLRAYRYGDWDIAAGQFFTNWRYNVHVIEPFAIPEDWDVWAGFDYGFSHPTVFQVMAMDNERQNIYVVGEHWQQHALPAEHAEAIFGLCERIGIPFPRIAPIAAGTDVFAKKGDESGKTIAEQYAGHGIALARADVDRVNGWGEILNLLGNPDPPEGARVISPRLHIFNTCHKLIECIPSMIHDEHRPNDVKKVDVDENGDGGDDSADCLRYGVMVKGIGGKPSEPLPQRDVVKDYDRSAWLQARDEEWTKDRFNNDLDD